MPSVGDILRFTVFQSYLGQVCLNVDFREIDSLPPGSVTESVLALSYANLYETEVLPIQHQDVTLTRVLCENLTDGVSFGETFPNVVGTQTGDPMPSYVSLAMKLSRTTKVTRNGSKRIVGVQEQNVDGNIQNYPSTRTEPAEFFYGGITDFIDPQDGVTTFEMGAVIVGRTLNPQGVYELDLSKINRVKNSTMKALVSTQNTRKQTA